MPRALAVDLCQLNQLPFHPTLTPFPSPPFTLRVGRLALAHHKEAVMADDLTKRGAGDRTRINVNEEHELRRWSEKFEVSPERLREVVEQTGPMADDVERAIKGTPGRKGQ